MSTQEQITIQAMRTLYSESDISSHFGNPDRNLEDDDGNRTEVSLIRDYIPTGGQVLVVGCAGGQESFAFLRAGYKVTGVDIVPAFIESARRHAHDKGFADRACFEVVDGFHWPVENESCDAVSMLANFLMHVPSREMRRALFAECFRVLRVEGVVLMEGLDRVHPGNQLDRPKWEPERSENMEKKKQWGFADESGAVVVPFHPCKGHVNAETIAPSYRADPSELWAEVEASGLRVIRVQMEEDPKKLNPSVVVVAAKD